MVYGTQITTVTGANLNTLITGGPHIVACAKTVPPSLVQVVGLCEKPLNWSDVSWYIQHKSNSSWMYKPTENFQIVALPHMFHGTVWTTPVVVHNNSHVLIICFREPSAGTVC